MTARSERFSQLEQSVTHLLEVMDSLPDPLLEVYPGWSAKDVLGHLVGWHESFARNTRDLSLGVQPKPLKGRLQDLNDQFAAESRVLDVPALAARLRAAQTLLGEHILNPRVEIIPYRVGSRSYSPEDHLEIVRQHILHHIGDIQKVVGRQARRAAQN
ncbi:maleylpyruvate isomerase N-terminal domain-containing protein [Ornatilinea apprima]|nr:maleylpyruvate isomerase N-terminal domain-containing protein [Ornatilinea apprima]